MNKNNLFLITVAVILAFGGYFFYQNQLKQEKNPNSGFEGIATSTANQAPGETVLTFKEQNDSGQSGTVAFAEMEGKANVKLAILGFIPAMMPPAHIHEGTCENLGAVKYPLVFPIEGKSETSLDVSLTDLKAQLPLAVNVHKSIDQQDVYVLCVDIVMP